MTEDQEAYVLQIAEEWRALVDGKSSLELMRGEFAVDIASIIIAQIEIQANREEANHIRKMWSALILGAFLHDRGLIKLREEEVQ